jgi:hypothetical protein
MRVAYAIPVRHVEALQDGSLLAVGIESYILRAQLPGRVGVPMVIALVGSQHEAQQGIQHELTLSALGPDLTPVMDPLAVQFQMAPGPNNPPGWEVRSVVPITAVFEVAEPGAYSFEIATDGGKPTSVTIMVNALDAQP